LTTDDIEIKNEVGINRRVHFVNNHIIVPFRKFLHQHQTNWNIMKQCYFFTALIFGVLLLMTFSACKKEKNNPFDDEAKQAYEAVISLQEESLYVLAGFETTMDSAAAVQELAQWLRDTTLVESVVVSSQGLSVKYANGIWGGLLLDPKRYDDQPVSAEYLKDRPAINSAGHPKNLPISKKAFFLPASIGEFPNANIRQDNSWSNSFNNLGYGYDNNTGAAVDLNCLAGIRELGSVLCLDSHGYAWPADNELSEVFFITGEKANLQSTTKFYQDILDHDILLLQFINEPASTYCISPGFISKYNDFSQDTVLFYGGFCYSYLGNWPSLTDACASGTYFGFDWIVGSNKCTDWAIDLVDHLADQNAANPWTVEDWMTSSPIAKQYFNPDLNKTISIQYNGNGALTLWKPAQGNGTIISTASDGAPVNIPGYTCTDYILKCNLTGQLPSNLGYNWEFGDGSSSYYTVNDNLCLYHHWPNAQSYTVRVTVTDISTDATICELTKVVNFVDPDYLPQLKAWNSLDVDFGPTESIHLTSGTGMYVGYFYFQTHTFSTPLTWTDSSFYARNFFDNDHEITTMEGNVSSDGRILKHALFTKTKSYQGFLQEELYLEVTNLPILSKDTLNCITLFWYDKYGTINQSYTTRVEFRTWDVYTSSWITISNIDWPTTYLSVLFKND
jgi:hypothetical protein